MKKISLKGLKEVLSEKELKEIIAGSGNGCSPTSQTCDTACTTSGGSSGHCNWVLIGTSTLCGCYQNP